MSNPAICNFGNGVVATAAPIMHNTIPFYAQQPPPQAQRSDNSAFMALLASNNTAFMGFLANNTNNN